MSVDRLSVTVPSELGAALRALAKTRKDTVSTVVTDAIAHEIRLAALDRALAQADKRFGAIPEALVTHAESELKRALVGSDATVILNENGRVVTTWANGAAGLRLPW